jgi:hypothetical protein
MMGLFDAVKKGVKMTLDPTSIPSGGKKGLLLGLWGMNEDDPKAQEQGAQSMATAGVMSQVLGQMMGGGGPQGTLAAGLAQNAFGMDDQGTLRFNMAPGTIQNVLGGMPGGAGGYGQSRMGISGAPMQPARRSYGR